MEHNKDCLCDKCDPVVTKITSDGGISFTREKALKIQFAEANAYAAKLFRENNKFADYLASKK